MPAFSRAIVIGFHAAALVSTLGPSTAPSLVALAAPLPAPAPPTIRLADYASRPPSIRNATVVPLSGVATQQNPDVAVVKHTTSDTPALQRRQTDILSTLSEHLQIISTSMAFSHMICISLCHPPGDLAARSSNENSDPQFCQQVVTEVTAYQNSLLDFQNFLGESDKGLGYLDPSNELEVSIKELVNSVKDSLKWIDVLVYNIPGLGSTLGPSEFHVCFNTGHLAYRFNAVVYQIKCILIGVLDFLEDFLDSLLNELQPTLTALIGQATTTACTNGYSCDGLL